MTRAIDSTHAVILSGGGAYGAYEVGVMRALLKGESPATNHDYLNPGIFTGTSVGAFNAAFMVSRPDEDICATIGSLESVWLNRIAEGPQTCGNGVFRFRGNPFNYSNPSCLTSNPARPFTELTDDGVFFVQDLFRRTTNILVASGSLSESALGLIDVSAFITAKPLKTLIRDTIRLDVIRRALRTLRVVATNWSTGQLKVFENHDMTDEHGHEIIQASAAIPGVFQPQTIAGETYVDGGLVMNTPLKSAIRAGGSTLHVIYMDPNVKNIPLSTLQSTIDVMDRMFTITSAIKVNEDIETAAWVNDGLAVIERTARGENLSSDDMQAFIKVANEIYQRLRAGAPYQKLTIHRYHPHEDLGGGTLGLLNFNRDRMAGLIERGFNDALNHDCAKSHCVLPSKGPDSNSRR